MSRTWRYCHLHSPLPLDPVEWSRSERFKQWLTLGRSLCDVESRFFYEHTNTQQTLAIAHYCPMLVHRFVLFVHVHLAILYAHSYPVTRLLYTKKKREEIQTAPRLNAALQVDTRLLLLRSVLPIQN